MGNGGTEEENDKPFLRAFCFSDFRWAAAGLRDPFSLAIVKVRVNVQ